MVAIATVSRLEDFVATHIPAVFKTIDEHVSSGMGELPSAGADYRNLWQSLGDQFGGGKNLRPSLTLAAYGGLGGDDPEAAVPVAAAMEMLHIAMLIHDDIIDHDEQRRGRLNIAGQRRAEVANAGLAPEQEEDTVLATALLGGDLAISSSYDLIASAALPAHHRIACLDLVTRAIRTTVAGELLDSYGDLVNPGDANPLLVAELKTAYYTCVVPLLAGAQLAGGDPTMVSHLEHLGVLMGMSFQLIDDDLGVFGDPERTGKSVLSDLRSGKRTEMLRLTFHMASPEDRARLAQLVGDPELGADGAREAREIIERAGGRDQARKVAMQHARKARTIAAERIPAPLSGYLVNIISSLEGRAS